MPGEIPLHTVLIESLLSPDSPPSTLIQEQRRGKRNELLDLGDISKEEIPYDSGHSQDLALSMLGDWGQLQEILVRARISLSGSVVYDIIDGFHRTSAFEMMRKDWENIGSLSQEVFKSAGWNKDLKNSIEKGEITLSDIRNIIDGSADSDNLNLKKKDLLSLTKWVQQRNNMKIKAVVLYGCSDEELYDLRVIAARWVKSVKFARMATWMQGSFSTSQWESPELTEMVKEGHLTLAQVVSLAEVDGSGKILKLTPEEAIEVKSWVREKAKKWKRPLSSLVSEMRLIEAAAPDLVARVRIDSGGRKGRGVLTQARLKAIVDHIPHEWELQRKLVDLIIEHNFTGKEMDFLAWALKNAIEIGDEETKKTVLNNPQFYFKELEERKEESAKRLEEERLAQVIAARKAEEKRTQGLKVKQKKVKQKIVEDRPTPKTTFRKATEHRLLELDSFKKIIERQLRIIKELQGPKMDPESLSLKVTLMGELDGIEIDFDRALIKFKDLEPLKLSPLENEILKTLFTYRGIPLSISLIELLTEQKYSRTQIPSTFVTLKGILKEISQELGKKVYEIKEGWYLWKE